jgi:hypothetical protein
VAVIPVREARQQRFCNDELIVVGGPTHAHGMSRPATRLSAIDAARKPGSCPTPDLAADGPGGLAVAAEPESFLVTNANQLYPGETDSARAWGASLAASLMPEPAGTAIGGAQ